MLLDLEIDGIFLIFKIKLNIIYGIQICLHLNKTIYKMMGRLILYRLYGH
jgi:hypothetical protein